MADDAFRSELVEALWRAVDRLPYILSATITGSFSQGTAICDVSDIDLVIVVERLDGERFAELQNIFRDELSPVLSHSGYSLQLNTTLGPLKFNQDRTAVLHLMAYTPESHRKHAVISPFTCFDWQRSALWRRASLCDMFPVFALQPRHFFSRRRSVQDYLRDLEQRAISYRELSFDNGYREIQRQKEMDTRDLHEFAYHVMRFLMQNFLKLAYRSNEAPEGDALVAQYARHFPAGMVSLGNFFLDLKSRKAAGDFTLDASDVMSQVTTFVRNFHAQFTTAFETEATRHVVFRHFPTEWNQSSGDARVFQGRTDTPMMPCLLLEYERLVSAIRDIRPERLLASPLARAKQTIAQVSAAADCEGNVEIDKRLLEIDYGECEGMTVSTARRCYPQHFEAWQRAEDPPFPGGGENTSAVHQRLKDFASERWSPGATSTAVCTHNVVLRCLLGEGLAIPSRLWHLLEVPHGMPIFVVSTQRFGWFVETDEDSEARIFQRFYCRTAR